jgi:large subunit ribosomal protein L29
MQATEIRELNEQELRDRIAELEEERFRLRLRSATQPLEQPHRLRDLRRDIARMKTVLTERSMKGSKVEGQGSTQTTASTARRASKAKRTTARRGR